MFRRLLVLIAALAVVGAGWSLPAQAAPVSGSATLDIVFFPYEQCLVSRTGSWFCEEGTKIDKISIKLEMDLVLTLSVSGVDITSVSIFTFRGLEFQSFTATGIVGPLAFRTQLIFAPNIIELELQRDGLGSLGYCVRSSDPGFTNAFGLFTRCPGANTALSSWIDGYYAISNLVLAYVMDANAHLTPALSFRKKVADLTLNIAGLVIGLRGLFANIGSTTTPAWRTGMIAYVEGQTVSGITLRAESWIGAKQGTECFGECKPLQVVRGGIVIDQFVMTEEKLIVRNLKIAGVTFGARLEFDFLDTPIGLTYLELTQDFALAPFGLTINNVMRIMGPTLTFVADFITTSLRIGEMATTVRAYIYPSLTGNGFTTFISDWITTFDPPGMRFTSTLRMCNDENSLSGGCTPGVDGVVFHILTLATAVGDVTVRISVTLGDFLTDYRSASVVVGWKLGNLTLTSETYLGISVLNAQVFRFGWTF